MGQKDLTQKNLEYYPDVFSDTVNALLYGGQQVLSPNSLQSAPTESLYPGHGKSNGISFPGQSCGRCQACCDRRGGAQKIIP